jgi:putative addiction module component (TIGR02574 family)
MTITIAELKKLSIAERIQLAEDLWDSVAVDQASEAYRLTPEQEAELQRRLAAHDVAPEAVPWSEVRDALFQRPGMV